MANTALYSLTLRIDQFHRSLQSVGWLISQSLIASVEEGVLQLSVDQQFLVRAVVASILSRSKPPPKKICKDVFEGLFRLKNGPDRLVLSADKGKFVVFMDRLQRPSDFNLTKSVTTI